MGHAEREQIIRALIDIVSGEIILARGPHEDVALERPRISLRLDPLEVLHDCGWTEACHIARHDTVHDQQFWILFLI